MAWDRVTAQALPSSEVTHLHLFRHGRVDTNGRRLCYGHTDFPLAAEGLSQVEGLVDFAQHRLPRPDGVLSSDLRRCTVIAEPMAEALGVPLRTSAGLREQDMGAWEGRAWEQLTAEDVGAVRRFWASYHDFRPPGGESFGDMGRRVDGWFEQRWSELRGGRWFVVAHTGVVRAVCCRLLGLPWSEALRFTPLPGSHSWLLVAQAGACLQVLGERPVGSSAGPAGEARKDGPGSSAVRGHPPRLALSGSAGTGKTTLGRALAERHGVPYVPEGMRARIEGGLSTHDLGPDGLRDLLRELWEEQEAREDAALAEAGGFVSDRSPVDFMAFWLIYNLSWEPESTGRWFDFLAARMHRYDRIICLPWGVLDLRADGVRSPNPWVQRHYQATVEGLLQREVPSDRLAFLPGLEGLEQRVRWVDDLLKEAAALVGAPRGARWGSDVPG